MLEYTYPEGDKESFEYDSRHNTTLFRNSLLPTCVNQRRLNLSLLTRTR